MGYWANEKDSDRTLFGNIGDGIPQSISDDCKRELSRRGYSDDTIREAEWYGKHPARYYDE